VVGTGRGRPWRSSGTPDLVRAAVDGRLPRGIGVARLIDPPIEWPRQWQMLGLQALHRGEETDQRLADRREPAREFIVQALDFGQLAELLSGHCARSVSVRRTRISARGSNTRSQ
jgi:hypothetical protein